MINCENCGKALNEDELAIPFPLLGYWFCSRDCFLWYIESK